jgi:Bacterial archaeo-eukaryotic release factor family 3
MRAPDNLTRHDLESLAAVAADDGWPCVSIYMPMVRAGDPHQNAVRLKNQLRTAEEELGAWQLRRRAEKALLEPLHELLAEEGFWTVPGDGLAALRARELFRVWRLPVAFRDLAVVEKRFHLKPLFQMFDDSGIFYVLTLSLNHVRLIRADRWSAEEVDLGGVPKSFREAMGDLTRVFGPKAGTAVSPSALGVARAPIFHGHGSGEDDFKAEIRKYFQRVDGGLAGLPIDRSAPVVLAGVEYLLAIYHQAVGNPRVLDEGLTGNADHLSPEELRAAAWELVEPVLGADRRRAAERFHQRLGTGLASSRLEEVLPAAHDGRVESVFAASGVRRWGLYDLGSRETRLTGGYAKQAEDLVDLAAVQTFLHGGAVHVVEPGQLPGGDAVAAVFRY